MAAVGTLLFAVGDHWYDEIVFRAHSRTAEPQSIESGSSPCASAFEPAALPSVMPAAAGAAVVTSGTGNDKRLDSLPGPETSVASAPPVAPATISPNADAMGSDEPATTGSVAHRSAPWPPGADALVEHSTRPFAQASVGRRADCPLPELRAVLADISARFGPLTVVATDQLKTANHKAGSTRQKLHNTCRAMDFRADPRRINAIKSYLRGRQDIGGVESYRAGVIHIDLETPSTR